MSNAIPVVTCAPRGQWHLAARSSPIADLPLTLQLDAVARQTVRQAVNDRLCLGAASSPEMEYVAIRENPAAPNSACPNPKAMSEDFGAIHPLTKASTLNLRLRRYREGPRHHPVQHQLTPKPETGWRSAATSLVKINANNTGNFCCRLVGVGEEVDKMV
jgi:hypothetical protein